MSAIDESGFSLILSKFGRVDSAKSCWNALEMEYNRTVHHIQEDFMSKVELQEQDEKENVDCHRDFGDCNADVDFGCDDDCTKETNDVDDEESSIAPIVMHDEICDIVDYDTDMTNYCCSQEDAEMEFVEDNVDAEENDKVNEIFFIWSPEEIKHYYGMMLNKTSKKMHLLKMKLK